MGVTIKKKAPAYRCWGGDDKFEKWADVFRTKFTFVTDSDADGKLSRVPLQQTLEKIRRTKVWANDAACLEKNLLYACYQAANTKKPEEYSAARARQGREQLLLQMKSQKKFVKGLIEFISRNPNAVMGFFSKAQKMPTDGRNMVLATSGEKLTLLTGLLTEYDYGLKKDIDIQFPLGVDTEFRFGPFLFDKEASEIERREPPNIVELGLIFHLVFLFRYFTAESAPGASQNSSVNSEFCGDELMVRGQMLNDGGKPCYAYVAALVNATLGKKFHPNDMKLRLKDLLALTDKASAKLAGRKKYIEFAGWETNSPA